MPMDDKQIAENIFIKRLLVDGYSVGIHNKNLYIHNVPIINSSWYVEDWILISSLETSNIAQHWVYSTIKPYRINEAGSCIPDDAPHYNVSPTNIDWIDVYQLSRKPPKDYTDYYHKMVTYINILLQNAKEVNPDASATRWIPSPYPSNLISILNHFDSNASRGNFWYLDECFYGHDVAIIGMGWTWSYILDLVSRVPVSSITLFDDDTYEEHNFFRSPGIISYEWSRNKSLVFAETYSYRHQRITAREVKINESNLWELDAFNFIFICIDSMHWRKIITDYLNSKWITYIDTGINVLRSRKGLMGVTKVSSHINLQESTEQDDNNLYHENIQIAELNSLAASLAVIEWKNIIWFYWRKNTNNVRNDIELNIEALWSPKQ